MTALTFRNVSASPDDPVAQWPQEAIQAALERGGLSDWRRLATAIRDDPWGPVARRVEEALTYSRPYGVARLMERVIASARDTAKESERQAVANEVEWLIEASDLTRVEFASRIGTSTSRLSTYATGKVTPSAGLLLRMRRVASRAGWGLVFSRANETERERAERELLPTTPASDAEPDWEDRKREMLDERARKLDAP